MKLLVATLAALLLALPGFAQTMVDNCCQAGRACATDDEWNKGWYDYQAGRCPAAAPAASSQPASPQPAATTDVDNCCQVGRACHTEAEWVQGWHDYQAGLCGGVTPAVSQPANTSWAFWGIDNCCQAGRACASDADWVQGWVDFQNGHCAAPGTSPMSSISLPNSYSFNGSGRGVIGPFALTRGKWRFSPTLARSANSYLYQVNSMGESMPRGQCFTHPTNWFFHDDTGAGLQLRPERHEFVVRSQCHVVLYLYAELSGDAARGQSWGVSLLKTG